MHRPATLHRNVRSGEYNKGCSVEDVVVDTTGCPAPERLRPSIAVCVRMSAKVMMVPDCRPAFANAGRIMVDIGLLWTKPLDVDEDSRDR